MTSDHELAPDPPEDEGRPRPSLEGGAPTEDEEKEAEGLHSDSISGTDDSSPARFYARLKADLAARGMHYPTMFKLTPEGEAPPCFTSTGVSFSAWLSAASMLGALVPYRLDMPAEPNYCRDCTVAFREQAKKSGTCRFPNVRFEKLRATIRSAGKTLIETEVVGVTRSPLQLWDDE